MPAAGSRALSREDLIDSRQFFRREADVRCRSVRFQMAYFVSAGNRHEKIALMKNPRERELGYGAFL